MRIRICLLTILTALPAGAGWAQTDPAAAVTVPDAAPRAVLEDSLGPAADEPILATQLAELTELEARDAGLDRLAEAHQVTRSAKGSATRSRGDPAPRSIPVRMVTDTRTSAAAVARFLETRGVTSDTLGAGGSGTRGILRADVPVHLLARLSEKPGVLGVSEEVPPRADNTGTQAQSSVTPALPHVSPATEDTADAAKVLRTGVVLEAGEIDSSTVAVGALVVAIHGQGERHPVSGEWGHLVTVKGYVQAVDAGTLTLSRTRDGRPERIALEHIQTLVLVEAPSQDEPADFLAAKEMHRPLLSYRGYRLLAKVAAGAGSGIVFAGMAIGVLDLTWENRTAHDGIGVLLYSVAIGCSVGFPLGVTSVDGYDSLPGTLLAGVIPAAAGVGMIAIDQEIDQERLGTALLLIYVAPVFGSLMVSEIWRNPPDYRGASIGLAPTFNGGFSAVATLRF